MTARANPSSVYRDRYEAFRELLRLNSSSLAWLAEIEQAYYGGPPLGAAALGARYDALSATVRLLVGRLADLGDEASSVALLRSHSLIDAGLREVLAFRSPQEGPIVVRLDMLAERSDAATLAGAKATNLAIARNILHLPTPDGFVLTAAAYARFVEGSGLREPLETLLASVEGGEDADLDARCGAFQDLVLAAQVPDDIARAALAAYDDLDVSSGSPPRVAVRSSAVGEDTSTSFAGQYVSVLDVTRENLLDAYKHVVASKFAPRALLYRLRAGLDDRDTPMSVLVLQMLDPRVAGVLYTAHPASGDATRVAIHMVEGLGERLVSGDVSAAVVTIERDMASPGHPAAIVSASGHPRGRLLLGQMEAMGLARAGIALESRFGCPQDVEWAIDWRGDLYILQSRPLHVAGIPRVPQSSLPLLAAGGETASPGWAVGRVFIARPGMSMPDKAVLVAESASPDLARLAGRAIAIVTETGSVACHLASVAREAGIPAILGLPRARELLADGAEVTVLAGETGGLLHAGRDEEIADLPSWRPRVVVGGPIMNRMRAVLDRLSPLHLTDPASADFSPEGCRTIHDLIRFTHERAIDLMFRLPATTRGPGGAVKLRTRIPLDLYVVDLGGGLDDRAGGEPHDGEIASWPLRAVWRGFSHPGIAWTGPANMDVRGLMTIMAESALASPETLQDTSSYAVISSDYLDLSARFGYHFAHLAALCGDRDEENYISVQFSGGVGSFEGRSLRAQFVAAVLEGLGFRVSLRGDLVEAAVKAGERASIESKLDQLGRLLASTRLLDVSIRNLDQIGRMTRMFFDGDYDFLAQAGQRRIEGFYLLSGDWSRAEQDGASLIVQDGSEWRSGLAGGWTRLMRRMVGDARYQDFLDNIKAYHYFPKLIAKDGEIEHGSVAVRAQPVAGIIDQAAGLVFGLRNAGNYFALRINALENNFVLFEYVQGHRLQRVTIERAIETGRWYGLEASLSGRRIRGLLDGEPLIDFEADRPVAGHVGLWTKADSVSRFTDFAIQRL
jgi:pyruvate,water dikinase